MCPTKCKAYTYMTSVSTWHCAHHCDWCTIETLYCALLWALSYRGNVENIYYYILKEMEWLFECRIYGMKGRYYRECKEGRKLIYYQIRRRDKPNITQKEMWEGGNSDNTRKKRKKKGNTKYYRGWNEGRIKDLYRRLKEKWEVRYYRGGKES